MNTGSSGKLRQTSERRRNAERGEKGKERRPKVEVDPRKRSSTQLIRRDKGRKASQAEVSPGHPSFISSPTRGSSTQLRRQSSCPSSSSRTSSALMSPRTSKTQHNSNDAVAPALPPPSKDSMRTSRPRCTKAAAASIVSTPMIKMRERRSSLPTASSTRSPFKRSRERRPSLSSHAWMNTAPKIDPEIAQQENEKKLLSPRRFHRRRTISSGRIETESSSDEQRLMISKMKISTKKDDSADEGVRKSKQNVSRQILATEPSEKVTTTSSDRKQRSRSVNHSSRILPDVPPQQHNQSLRRARCTETDKDLSGASFRKAFVSTVEKGASSSDSMTSTSTTKVSRSDGHSSSSASRSVTARKPSTSAKEKKMKHSNYVSADEEASLDLSKIDRTDTDTEGFFAVRSFLYEQ